MKLPRGMHILGSLGTAYVYRCPSCSFSVSTRVFQSVYLSCVPFVAVYIWGGVVYDVPSSPVSIQTHATQAIAFGWKPGFRTAAAIYGRSTLHVIVGLHCSIAVI